MAQVEVGTKVELAPMGLGSLKMSGVVREVKIEYGQIWAKIDWFDRHYPDDWNLLDQDFIVVESE